MTPKKGKQMNGEAIVAAVNLLREKYPTETVEIWSGYAKHGHGLPRFTARVGEPGSDDGLQPIYVSGPEPMEAARALVNAAGTRDPNHLKRQRIAKLRDELAKLEGEL